MLIKLQIDFFNFGLLFCLLTFTVSTGEKSMRLCLLPALDGKTHIAYLPIIGVQITQILPARFR